METFPPHRSDQVVALPRVDPAGPVARVLGTEESLLSHVRANVLLIGTRAITDAAVSDLESICHPPIHMWRCGERSLTLPPFCSVNTLVLHDVAALSRDDQQTLNDWVSSENGRTQVIAISAVPLFPLVKGGVFLEALYYRLNILYVDLSA
jgi:hypothetical protein